MVSRSSCIRYQKINLSTLVNQIVDTINTQNPNNNTTFDIQDNVYAFGDIHLLKIVLENLMTNAYIYSSKKSNPKIEFGMHPEKAFVCYIKDNGIGFSPEDASKIFAPFSRSDSAQNFPGFGIGLATVKRIIDRHAGKIWAEGAINKGATFYFSLPNN